MREAVTKTIDGVEYTISQFGATKGVKMLHRLGKIIGEPLANMFPKNASQSLLDADLTGQMFGQAVKAFFDNCTEDVFERTVKDLLEGTLADGKPLMNIFDVHFAQNYGALFKLLAAILEVQYGSFLAGLGALKGVVSKNQTLTAEK